MHTTEARIRGPGVEMWLKSEGGCVREREISADADAPYQLRSAVQQYRQRTGAGDHVLNEASEEALGLEVRVVLLHLRLGRLLHLHCSENVALGFEALDDLANQAALDAVRLDHDVPGGRKDGETQAEIHQ